MQWIMFIQFRSILSNKCQYNVCHFHSSECAAAHDVLNGFVLLKESSSSFAVLYCVTASIKNLSHAKQLIIIINEYFQSFSIRMEHFQDQFNSFAEPAFNAHVLYSPLPKKGAMQFS